MLTYIYNSITNYFNNNNLPKQTNYVNQYVPKQTENEYVNEKLYEWKINKLYINTYMENIPQVQILKEKERLRKEYRAKNHT